MWVINTSSRSETFRIWKICHRLMKSLLWETDIRIFSPVRAVTSRTPKGMVGCSLITWPLIIFEMGVKQWILNKRPWTADHGVFNGTYGPSQLSVKGSICFDRDNIWTTGVFYVISYQYYRTGGHMIHPCLPVSRVLIKWPWPVVTYKVLWSSSPKAQLVGPSTPTGMG